MASNSLQDFVQDVTGESHLRIEHDFGDGFVRLRTSEAERRQAAQDIQCSENIVLELLRNSRDAHATHVFLATSREGNKRMFTVIDNGEGIPRSMHEHVFESRVTSKLDTSHMDDWGLHGRGMALYSIAVNANEAYVVDSDSNLGCSMRVVTDVTSLKEKSDQSTFPTFKLDEGGMVNVRGPRNILRTACEFSIAARDTCSVYVGSPAEVVATMYAYGTSTLSALDRAFCRDETLLPLAKRLATASDPHDLARIASTIGLSISSRTARRIIDGVIEPLEPMLDRIELTASEPRAGTQGKKRLTSGKKPKLTTEEKAQFAASVRNAYAPLAHRYYLSPNVDPKVSVTSGRIVISIPLVDQ